MIHGHPPQRDALLLLSGAAFTLSSYALFPTLILCPRYLSFFLSLSSSFPLGASEGTG